MEQTLILLKPDCIHRRLVGTIIGRFEQKGLPPRAILGAVHRDARDLRQ